MKPIELTKQHKSKLLEMCKVLFPNHDFALDKWKQCFVTLGSKSKDLYEEHIHWFEFCMTHLVDKIYYPKPKPRGATIEKIKRFFFQTFIDSIEGATSGYDHPIDYLYKEFKKLKLN